MTNIQDAFWSALSSNDIEYMQHILVDHKASTLDTRTSLDRVIAKNHTDMARVLLSSKYIKPTVMHIYLAESMFSRRIMWMMISHPRISFEDKALFFNMDTEYKHLEFESLEYLAQLDYQPLEDKLFWWLRLHKIHGMQSYHMKYLHPNTNPMYVVMKMEGYPVDKPLDDLSESM